MLLRNILHQGRRSYIPSIAVVVVGLFVLPLTTPQAVGEEIKRPDRETAGKILSRMYKSHVIGAIVGTLEPGAYKVVGVAVRGTKEDKMEVTLEYDADLGWIHYEFAMENARGQAANSNFPPVGGNVVAHVKLRIWSASGYKEILIGDPAKPE